MWETTTVSLEAAKIKTEVGEGEPSLKYTHTYLSYGKTLNYLLHPLSQAL